MQLHYSKGINPVSITLRYILVLTDVDSESGLVEGCVEDVNPVHERVKGGRINFGLSTVGFQ